MNKKEAGQHAGIDGLMMSDDKDKTQLTADQGGNVNLDKIRDILFGAEARETDKRFARLEERLLKEAERLRNDVKNRFDSLEQYMKKETETVMDRLKTEQAERTEAVKDVSKELRDLAKTVEKKTAQLEDRVTKGQRTLRDQLLDQNNLLTDEIRKTREDLSSTFDEAIQELRTEKPDRAALAELFMEVSMRLTNEFKIPNPE